MGFVLQYISRQADINTYTLFDHHNLHFSLKDFHRAHFEDHETTVLCLVDLRLVDLQEYIIKQSSNCPYLEFKGCEVRKMTSQ